MAQSQNKTVEFNTTGVSYLGLGGKVGKFLIGETALEFYSDANVEDYIQLPWISITAIGANVSGKKVSRHFEEEKIGLKKFQPYFLYFRLR